MGCKAPSVNFEAWGSLDLAPSPYTLMLQFGHR